MGSSVTRRQTAITISRSPRAITCTCTEMVLGAMTAPHLLPHTFTLHDCLCLHPSTSSSSSSSSSHRQFILPGSYTIAALFPRMRLRLRLPGDTNWRERVKGGVGEVVRKTGYLWLKEFNTNYFSLGQPSSSLPLSPSDFIGTNHWISCSVLADIIRQTYCHRTQSRGEKSNRVMGPVIWEPGKAWWCVLYNYVFISLILLHTVFSHFMFCHAFNWEYKHSKISLIKCSAPLCTHQSGGNSGPLIFSQESETQKPHTHQLTGTKEIRYSLIGGCLLCQLEDCCFFTMIPGNKYFNRNTEIFCLLV